MQSESQSLERHLRRELGRPLPRVGFDRELRERYRGALHGDHKLARMCYYLTVLVVAVPSLMLAPALMRTPPAFLFVIDCAAFGLVLPLCLVAAAADFLPLSRRFVVVVQVTAMVVFWLGLLALQRGARPYHFYLPPELVNIAVLFAAMLCGFPLKRMLRGIAVFTGLNILSEWLSDSPLQAFYMDALLITVLGLTAAAGAFFMEVLQRRLWLAGELAKLTACTDPLTGLITRSEFNHRFAEVLALAGRQQRPVAVMLMDLDNFKSINDGYGHIYGDDVLRRVGTALRDLGRRPFDIQARYGGEELVIVRYDCDESAAQQMALGVLDKVRQAELPQPAQSAAPRVTVSAGVVVLVPDPSTRAADALRVADDLMYQAKRAGKDRYLLARGAPPAGLTPALAGV
ncbi:MAG: GGDEF domain-containing protein [Nevskia sp.]|nr:GGDEF domain-containing protein [Nevskia sp.]